MDYGTEQTHKHADLEGQGPHCGQGATQVRNGGGEREPRVGGLEWRDGIMYAHSASIRPCVRVRVGVCVCILTLVFPRSLPETTQKQRPRDNEQRHFSSNDQA